MLFEKCRPSPGRGSPTGYSPTGGTTIATPLLRKAFAGYNTLAVYHHSAATSHASAICLGPSFRSIRAAPANILPTAPVHFRASCTAEHDNRSMIGKNEIHGESAISTFALTRRPDAATVVRPGVFRSGEELAWARRQYAGW